MERFENWLRNNTTLKERTIINYRRTIERFFDGYRQPTVKNMNEFISRINRTTMTTYIKYAFKYYLRYIEKEEDYKNLVGVRVKPRKKEGVYIPKDDLLNIVMNIENRTYRLVALIQYLTGARAGDVLRFSYNNLVVNDDGTLKLRLRITKTDEYSVFIGTKYAGRLRDYIETCGRKYSFLLGDSDSLRKLVDNNYRYYWNALKKSATSFGYPKFATHDFRRNLAEDARISTNDDMVAVKNLLGHKRIETTLKYIRQKRSEKENKELAMELRG